MVVGDVLPLGEAIASLLRAPLEELLLSAVSDAADSLSVSQALRSVEEYILGAGDTPAGACWFVLELFLDHGAGKRRGRRHRQISALLGWLCTHPRIGRVAALELARCFQTCAARQARLLLSAALALQEALPARRAARCAWDPLMVVQLLRSLLSVCAASSSQGRPPSVLEAAAADAAVGCFSEVCRRAMRDDTVSARPWVCALCCCARDAQRLLHCVRDWRRVQLTFVTVVDEISAGLLAHVVSPRSANVGGEVEERVTRETSSLSAEGEHGRQAHDVPLHSLDIEMATAEEAAQLSAQIAEEGAEAASTGEEGAASAESRLRVHTHGALWLRCAPLLCSEAEPPSRTKLHAKVCAAMVAHREPSALHLPTCYLLL